MRGDTDRGGEPAGEAGMVTASPQLRRARWAVTGLFFANGAMFGSWVARIPPVAESLGLTERQLGLALLGIAVATVADRKSVV